MTTKPLGVGILGLGTVGSAVGRAFADRPGLTVATLPLSAHGGDGAFGQYCIVLPEQDAVIAITSGVMDMQKVMNLIWDKLLPALKAAALDVDDESRTKLEGKLKGLLLTPQAGTAIAATEVGKKYVLPPNDHKLEAVRLEDDGRFPRFLLWNGIRR